MHSISDCLSADMPLFGMGRPLAVTMRCMCTSKNCYLQVSNVIYCVVQNTKQLFSTAEDQPGSGGKDPQRRKRLIPCVCCVLCAVCVLHLVI